MTAPVPTGPAAAPERPAILDPTERASEILFGLIMVLTFTGSLSAATSGRQEVRTMLIGAIGCNLAWGIIDAIFYLINTLGARGRGLLALKRVRAAESPTEGQRLISDEFLPPVLGALVAPVDLEPLRRRFVALANLPERPPLRREDFLGAVGVFLLVFLSTFPVVVPFFFVPEATRALRISNGVAIVLLFLAGYRVAKYAGYRPWRTGFGMVVVGLLLVGLTIALGG